MEDIIKILKWDSDFFGMTTGRTTFCEGISTKMPEVMKTIAKEKINFLYHFQNPNNKEDLVALKDSNFYITDQKVTLYQKIDTLRDYVVNSNIKPFKIGFHDFEKLYNISYQISEKSRYSYDTHIPYQKVIELYKLWIYNGINSNFCDETLIYEEAGIIKGFVMIKIHDNKADISLIGVEKNYRSKGIATTLITACKEYCIRKGITEFYVDTQFRNVEALNFYIKNGFNIHNTLLVYHYYNTWGKNYDER